MLSKLKNSTPPSGGYQRKLVDSEWDHILSLYNFLHTPTPDTRPEFPTLVH
ncbi:hypothetical protein PGT21_006332 [Puccinia graminis f. sp. tritici]|uniref:Uncharacterized protein n=1 Tax=Puccinia graminis f. sp. tritici TaxID=56615 RepID=A0A5B0PKI9_PUCGR|nr:hypothetical protein PGT21_006332 [Puccinia graminis f. sp. tritici]